MADRQPSDVSITLRKPDPDNPKGVPGGDPWSVTDEQPNDPWKVSGQQRMGEYLKAQGTDATPKPEDVQADESTPPGAPPAPEWKPVNEEPAKPQGRGIWQAIKDYPAHVLEGLATLPKRAIEGAAQYQPGSGEVPDATIGPAIEAATLPMGTGAIAGVPLRAGETALGAGAVRGTPVAVAATKQVASKLADDLQALRQSSVADRAEVGNTIRALPEEATKPAIGEKLYHAVEDPAEAAKLTPEEKAINDQHLAPLRQEQAQLAKEATDLGGGNLIDDPNYMHRIAKGHAPAYDSLSGDAFDPVTGTRGLPRTTSALQERKFYVLEKAGPEKISTAATKLNGKLYEGRTHAEAVNKFMDETGANPEAVAKAYGGEGFITSKGRYVSREEAQKIAEQASQIPANTGRKTFANSQLNAEELAGQKPLRKVVSQSPDGVTVWNNKTPTNVATSGELAPGETIDLGGQPWTVKQATTKEIEQHTATEYHKNAFVNTADAVVRLREVVRNLKFVDEVKKSPWWLDHAQAIGGNREAPKGWREPLMPQFKGWKVDPKIADVLDDFYKPGILEPENALRKINQFATSSMFWNPIPHMQNVGVHWAVGRGWDWIRPGPLRHFATDMTRAIKATVTQDKDYQRFLRQGGGLVYGGVKNADFYGEMARHMGMEVEKHWGQWKPLANKLGFKKPYEFVAWWYGKMRETLWASSDMFMMHRYLELERKGMSSMRAMKEAEKHIPNYRIPTTILGSRTASRIAQEPAAVVFARYHYGMWKSFMNMATDLAKGTMAEKKEALGNVAALAFMGYVAYPIVDAIYQKVTGDPNAKLLRRGAMTVPHGAAEVTRDRQSFSQFLGSNITAAPATKEILQQFFGKDFFTGQELGPPIARAEHAAKAFLSPYNTINQMTTEAENARSPARTAVDTVIGGENTSERTEKGKLYGAKLRAQAEKKHAEKPQGLIEKGYYAAKHALGFSDGPLGAKNEHRYETPRSAPTEPVEKRSHHKKGFY